MSPLINPLPPNTRLQRARQLTRFRRQMELTLDDREVAGDRHFQRAERHAAGASPSLGEQGFRVLQDEMFVASTSGGSSIVQTGAFSRHSTVLSSERQRTECPLNRVKIPRLRSPLSRKSFGASSCGRDF
jgi:hypothetical protein